MLQLLIKDEMNPRGEFEFSRFCLDAGEIGEEGIMVDILLRLPVESLIRLKRVCKSWRSLISDPQFARSHLNRLMLQNPNSSQRLLLVVGEDYNYVLKSLNYESANFEALKLDVDANDSLTAVDYPVRLESPIPMRRILIGGSCDGLVCLDVRRGVLEYQTILIWNPTIGEFKEIHAPCEEPNEVLGFGYDPVSDDYKILARGKKDTGIFLFALKDKSWRRPCPNYMPNGRGVYLNGCVHWLYELGTSTHTILSFDLSEEKFQVVVPLPDINNVIYDHLSLLRGCLFLCTIDRNDGSSKYWIMSEYSMKSSWTEFCDLTSYPKRNRKSVLCLRTDGKVLFHSIHRPRHFMGRRYHLLSLYSPEDNSYQFATFGSVELLSAQMYVESLVSP